MRSTALTCTTTIYDNVMYYNYILVVHDIVYRYTAVQHDTVNTRVFTEQHNVIMIIQCYRASLEY